MTSHDMFGPAADAQILDRGYRSYEGHRTGVRGAMATVARHSIQRALGMRRTIWAKVLPAATIGFAYVPAIVFVGVVALVPADQLTEFILPSYGEYYSFVIAAIMVFVALVAPEVLCTDRRTGMLGVYLAAPLDRDSYLAAKAAGIAAVLALVCAGPTLLLLIANLLQSQGPDGVVETVSTFARVVGAGVAVTLLFTGITMGITSLTDRKAVAAAAIMLLFLVSLSVAGSIAGAGGPQGAAVLAPTLLSLEVALRSHGETSPIMDTVPSITIWTSWALWTVGGFALARNRLRSLPVTR